MGVDLSRLHKLELDLKIEVSCKKLLKYFEGVAWVNMLLSDLHKKGWGHQAVDLLLSCESRSRCCMYESC